MPIDVLMLQLGTPRAPTASALRPYLREFLLDPRVLEMSPWARWLLVQCVIVPFRAPKSAKKYERIWDPVEGSPLLTITRKQQEALQKCLGADFRVHFAMRYGDPSIPSVVSRILQAGPGKLVVLPMYPQYSATTTASALDALFDALKQERVLPAVRVISEYHDDEDYIQAVVTHLRKHLEETSPPEMHLLSFHGIPIDYIKRGDPYMRQSAVTAKAIAKEMGWSKGEWRLVFQSRLGRQKWLTPYTDETLVELARSGVKRVLVAQPGFTADCLETIDEIGNEGREEFERAGGEELSRVPCLNDAPYFIDALANRVRKESLGWM